jgi:transposase
VAQGRGPRQGADDREAASPARRSSSRPLRPQVEQLELLIDDIEAGVAETLARVGVAESDAAEATETSASSKKKCKPSNRAPLPDHLPAETIVHEAPCVCPACGGDKFGRIGADEREVLEYVPSHFKRVVHVRPKMSCRACETVVQALMPTLPIEKGRPGPALLAHVVVSKFCDHLPLHRQADIYTRSGVEIDRSVMAAWIPERSATRFKRSGFERPFQARQSRLGMAS